MKKSGYSQADKLAYYKKLAGMGQRPNAQKTRYNPTTPQFKRQRKNYNSGPKTTLGRGLAYVGDAVQPVLKPLASALLPGVFGSGDYTITNFDRVQSNVLTHANSPPIFGGAKVRIRHREFIQDISGSTAFALTNFHVNPGDEQTFPWLSTVAQNFQKYKMHGCIFEFKSTCATALTNGTNTAMGTVIMASDYNAANANFQSKIEMEQTEFSNSFVPYCSALHGIECAPNYNPLGIQYIRIPSGVPAGQSVQFYDICDFAIATQGMQAINVIGELWVSYDVELISPILTSGQIGDSINSAHYRLDTSVTTSNYFSGAAIQAGSNMDFTVSLTTLRFPDNIVDGKYLLQYIVNGSSAAVVQPTVAFTTNCSALNLYVAGTIPTVGTVATVNVLIKLVAIRIDGGGATITFSAGTLPASITGGDLIISQIPDDLV